MVVWRCPECGLTLDERGKGQRRCYGRSVYPHHARDFERLELVPAHQLEEAERLGEELARALESAAGDLGKAANQFAGLVPEGRNVAIFEAKERVARDALANWRRHREAGSGSDDSREGGS